MTDLTLEQEIDEILKSPDAIKLVEYELSPELLKQGVRPNVYPMLTDRAKQQLLSLIKEEKIKELQSWFELPKHYPGEEYRDEPFVKVKCKTPGQIRYQTLDSNFTYAVLTRLQALKQLKNDINQLTNGDK